MLRLIRTALLLERLGACDGALRFARVDHGRYRRMIAGSRCASLLKILGHLRLPTEVPATAPARLDPQLEIDWEFCDEEPVYDVDADSRGGYADVYAIHLP